MNAPQPVGLRETCLATLWFVLLAAAATAPALFGSQSLGPEAVLDVDPLYARDPDAPPLRVVDKSRVCYDLPRDFAAADGFAAGRFDLWNPRIGFGVPLWGEGGAPFFPAKIPFYLAPSRRTYDLGVALRLPIAALGAFLLARRRGLGPVAALAAGSLFELSGTIVSTLQFGMGAPTCLLPWVLLGATSIAQRRSLAAAAGTGLALAAAATSGHPMLAVVDFAGFGTAAAADVAANWRRPRAAWAIAGLAVLALLLGLAVAAPALLPVLEAQHAGRLYKETIVYTGLLSVFRTETRYALPVALFAPALLDWLRTPLWMGFPYRLVAPAVGLLSLVLAVAGLLRRGLNASLVAVGLAGVGVTVAPPILGAIGRLPILQYVYPMYAWPLVVLPLTQAAGSGVEALETRRGHWVVLAALAIVLAGASSLLLVPDVFPKTLWSLPLRQALISSLADRAGRLRLVLPLLLVPSLVVALVLLRRTRSGEHCAILATVFAALELLVSVAPTTWFRDSAVLGSPPSPATRFLQEKLAASPYRMLAWPLTVGDPATPSLFGLSDVRGVAALPVERYVRYLEAITPSAGWYVWQTPGNVLRHPLLDLAGMRYVVLPVKHRREPRPLLGDDPAVRLVYRDQYVAIYENGAALPRARIVRAAVPVHDREEAFQRLVEAARERPHVAAAELVDRAFIEPGDDGRMVAETRPATSSATDTVRIVPGNDPDRVELEATLAAPGWVVLADTFYPGWSATVDGASTPIHPADLLFRAVFVPAGTHRVVFRYDPLSVRLGLALAVVGLGASSVILLRSAQATRRADHA